ncbi:hypothetical protein JRC04_11625 [Mycolicibacterium sp. S2-37]|uniref:hypothetical protein n=1 Tax=Mycolicibacterium sp. S2-37 TaxID=2810297 RepID=UPI001A947105|nr:hypothetical protein [Mycolicibacterium sp. S2-37]MBO0678114.1 hypothetical protein [Mycolicibacterium sp. S2-37]
MRDNGYRIALRGLANGTVAVDQESGYLVYTLDPPFGEIDESDKPQLQANATMRSARRNTGMSTI